MKLAVLGAGGRTGREVLARALAEGHEVVALVRTQRALPSDPRLSVHLGDALDAAALTRLVHGCDAVICVLAPGPDAPPTLSSASSAVLVSAMKAAGITRLAVVTGAMNAERAQLGAFYRWLASLKSIAALLADRHTQELALRASGFEVTILRPPQLRNGPPSREGIDVDGAGIVRMSDQCRRADLAQTLLDAVTRGAHAGETVFVRSRIERGAFWRGWLLRCGSAEFVGIGLAALVAVQLMTAFPDPQTLAQRLLVYVSLLTVGALEGALIGLAQGTMLQRIVPNLRVTRFAGWTALVAMLAWAVGMAPSTFLPLALGPAARTAADSAAASASEPPVALILAISAAGGALGGLLIAAAQVIELRQHVPTVRPWIAATAAGWALALPLDMLGATLPDATTPPSTIVALSVIFGLLAGVTFALPTGVVAWRYRRGGGGSTRGGSSATP